jgi:hypothetical protein
MHYEVSFPQQLAEVHLQRIPVHPGERRQPGAKGEVAGIVLRMSSPTQCWRD